MGNQKSLSLQDLATAKAKSSFSEKELKRLHRRFRKLDADKDGALNLNEFLAVPGLENNPLVRRVMEIFDEDKSESVDFKEFLQTLTIFTNPELKAEKLYFAFRLYDVNSDGYISPGDLFKVLKTMVGDNLDEGQLQQLVDRTILQGDHDKDGKLNFEEFSSLIQDSEIDSKLVIELHNTNTL